MQIIGRHRDDVAKNGRLGLAEPLHGHYRTRIWTRPKMNYCSWLATRILNLSSPT
jgi:hypothetical protein